eukprot:PhF_6_TR8050/c0_g1_i1/m.12463
MSELLDVQTAEDRTAAYDDPPYLSLTLSPYFPKIPELMEYESRWTEVHNGVPLQRMMLLLYYPAIGLFHVMTDDTKIPLKVVVYSKYNPGTPVPPWELHVGAVIEILGRPTTLSHASPATVAWLDQQARKLYKRKQKSEAKLNKYLPIPKYVDVIGAPRAKLEGAGTSTVFGGCMNLYNLATCVMNLETELTG